MSRRREGDRTATVCCRRSVRALRLGSGDWGAGVGYGGTGALDGAGVGAEVGGDDLGIVADGGGGARAMVRPAERLCTRSLIERIRGCPARR